MKDANYIDDIILNGSTCPYCGSKSVYVDSSCIYGKSYGMIYLCKPCDAYCGVHKGTDISLGRLANKELRELKKSAHFYFDKIWQLEHMGRTEAYEWIAGLLGLEKSKTHIGMFDETICKDVIYYSKQFLNDMRRLDLDFGATPSTNYYQL